MTQFSHGLTVLNWRMVVDGRSKDFQVVKQEISKSDPHNFPLTYFNQIQNRNHLNIYNFKSGVWNIVPDIVNFRGLTFNNYFLSPLIKVNNEMYNSTLQQPEDLLAISLSKWKHCLEKCNILKIEKALFFFMFFSKILK